MSLIERKKKYFFLLKIKIKESRNLRFELQIKLGIFRPINKKERVRASVPQFMKDDLFGRVSNLKKSAKW